ncbi:MAG: ATP-binding protein [Deltaproteobacteria bacterium]|nr:MAG: ATP-binding protein [Deltaproteobacteria bacterium]
MSRDPVLPPWADELKLRYLAGEASMFLVHGNVRDLYPWDNGDGTVHYVPLRQFLERFLGRSKDIVVYYNLSEGIELPDKAGRARFRTAINARRALRGEEGLAVLPRAPRDVLPIIEDLVTDPTQRAAVVLDYIEMIAPMGDLTFMGESDKSNLVTLERWASDPALLSSDNLILLIAENPSDVHRRLRSNTHLAQVAIPRPDTEARLAFIRRLDGRGVELEMDEEGLAKVTGGLSLVQIRGLFRRARQSGEPISFRTVSRRKKAIIEQECQGLVEFVDPEHDFSHVGGLERLKRDLLRVARAIKAGHRNRVPMGMLFVGPMGTGKTFVAEAFAAESGLTCLKFKNFREKWVGSTEGNLEKILQVVDGLGYVLLILDEADRSMGNQGDSDGGTSSRVIARLKEFMSDTSHRGRVVILMMTNRPDKLDTDLKRPGRFDFKIPFFFPEQVEERLAILQAIVRKNDLELADDADLRPVAAATAGYSAAELEAVLLAATTLASDDDRDVIEQSDLDQAARDVIPSRDTRMLQYMEMLAVFESSSRRMLPERFRDLDTAEVQRRLDQLRVQLGRRV